MPFVEYFHEILSGPPRPVSCSPDPLTILGLRAVCQRALRWKVLIMLSTVCIFLVSAQRSHFIIPAFLFRSSSARAQRYRHDLFLIGVLGNGNRQRSTPCFLLKSAPLSLSLYNFVFGAPLSVVPKALLLSWVIDSTIVCGADRLSSGTISTAR